MATPNASTRGSTSLKSGVEKLLEGDDDALVAFSRVKRMVEALIKCLPVQGNGIKIVEGPHGREIHADGAAGGRSHPFECTMVATESGLGFVVEPGTYNGVMPELGGTPLNAGPIGSLLADETWVYLEVEYTLHEANDFVYGATFVGANVIISDSEISNPQGPVADGVFLILLATFAEDGGKTSQPIRGSLTGSVCGVADGSGTATLAIGILA
jgi:hypothetical protein